MSRRAKPTHEPVSFVIDCSVAIAWVLSDEQHEIADLALSLLESGRGHVPALWKFEVLNVLLVAERRGRTTPAEVAESLHDLSKLVIEEDHDPAEEAVLAIARRCKLSAYDASYLELASRKKLPIATLDRSLQKAARTSEVELIGQSR